MKEKVDKILDKNPHIYLSTSLLLKWYVIEYNDKNIYMKFRHSWVHSDRLYFNTTNKIDSLEKLKDDIFNKFTYGLVSSDWILHSVDKNHTSISIKETGGSYVELPKWIRDKHCCVNVKNDDENCFDWSILSALYPVKNHTDKVSSYSKVVGKINYGDLSKSNFAWEDIFELEMLNKDLNIKINVIEYCDNKNKQFEPRHIYVPKKDDKFTIINLLLYKGHYCWIKKIDTLLKNNTNNHMKLHYCLHCFNGFLSVAKLEAHKGSCDKYGYTYTTLYKFPTGKANEKTGERDDIFKFKNINKMCPKPFVIYADFESINYDVENKKKGNTELLKEQKASGYHIYCSDQEGKVLINKTYRGEDAVDNFFKTLQGHSERLNDLLEQNKSMIISEHKELKNDRVKDHDHYTGYYRGPAHSKCNLAYRYNTHGLCYIPVVFHNLKGYDSHLLISKAGKHFVKIKAIHLNKEKALSFDCDNFRFIDSWQFLSTSLENLVSNLKKSDKPSENDKKLKDDDIVDENYYLSKLFPHTYKAFGKLTREQFDLLTQKGVFPYEYMTSFDQFDETHLPPQKAFDSKLSGKCEDDDYKRANRVWKIFNMKKFGEYQDLYVKTDVTLLADVFENFRNICLNSDNIKLDPAHYYGLPGLGLDTLLKNKKHEIQLITDSSMYHEFNDNIRGGLCYINQRYAKVSDGYKIVYWDANNLYGWAMSQYLPTGNFKWEDVNNWKKDDGWDIDKILSIVDEANTGYVFNVDIEYPKDNNELMDKHIDFPLCVQNKKISNKMLSEYCKKLKLDIMNLIRDEDNKLSELPVEDKNASNKLVADFLPKNNYLIHYRNLKYALEQGLKLVKINKIISFDQAPWMKEYIDINSNNRAKATNKFEKDFWKLLNNSSYGKTMEKVERRVNVHLIPTKEEDKILRYLNHPRNKNLGEKIGDDLMLFDMAKTNVTFNKPIYTGFCVTELSKLHMQKFHYDFIKVKYPKDYSKLLFTDTDSLCYILKTENVHKDMLDNLDRFDMSNYPEDSPYRNISNTAKIGFFKNETAGTEIIEFVGLKPKCYSIKCEDSIHDSRKGKGVNKNLIKHTLTHENYKNILFNEEQLQQKDIQHSLRSFKHQIYLIEQSKISLSCYDDKKYYKNNVESIPYGHYSIVK